MKLRAMVMAGLTATAGLGMVGTGAYAGGDNSSHSESFNNQSLNVVLSASGAVGNGTSNIMLGSLGPTGSSFITALTPITITNNGHTTASAVALQLNDLGNSPTLRGETWVCLFSGGRVLFNEPLVTVEGYGPTKILNLALAPHATATYTVVYYAGSTENTGCGNAFTGYRALGGGGYSGQYGVSEAYPAGTANSAAASLTNKAEGGSLLATMTVSYLGSTDSKSSGDQDGDQHSGRSGKSGNKDGGQQSVGSNKSGNQDRGPQ